MNALSIWGVNLIEEEELNDNVKKMVIFTKDNKYPIILYIHRTDDCKTKVI